LSNVSAHSTDLGLDYKSGEGVLRPHIQIDVGKANVNKCSSIQYPT